MEYPVVVCVAILCIGSLYPELKYHRIPNYLTFSGMAAGIFYQCAFAEGIVFSVAGLLLGIGVLLPFYLLGGMGAGDAKLMGAVGTFLGPAGVFEAFLFSALIGGVYAVVLMTIHGYLRQNLKRYGRILKGFFITQEFIYVPPPKEMKDIKLFYGVAISVGTLFSVLFPYELL